MKEWFKKHQNGLTVLACAVGAAIVIIVVFCIVFFGTDTGLSQLLKDAVGR